mmetsp:Transcript_12673/g.26818  ORF Transcript_12673/g.26818 Transcript_12673/m.26818 type:complete len:216 (-) Transcript_12673:67-714(-)
MKPGLSSDRHTVFPMASAKTCARRKHSSDVCMPRMSSTSFMMGGGFMKCMPTTLSGRAVAFAMRVMEIELVLEARMVVGGVILSSEPKMERFRASFSLTASTTKSTSLKDLRSGVATMLLRESLAWSSVSAPFLMKRASDLPMPSSPRPSAASLVSCRRTFTPFIAASCAIPAPIWPAPITPSNLGRPAFVAAIVAVPFNLPRSARNCRRVGCWL